MVGDIRSTFPLARTQPGVYRPLTPSGFAAPSRHGVTVAIRVAPGMDALAQLPREIERIDPQVTVFEVVRMVDDVAQTQYLAHFATLVYGGMGVFGLIPASVGLAGVTAQAAALALTWALASVVETLAETTHTTMTDPVLLLGGPALLAALALVACYLPARRSTRIDPAITLRAE